MTVFTSHRSCSPTREGPPRTSYDLLTEPWLMVRTPDGVREVGLLETFERAHEFQGLAGDIPTQEAACLRLLLAILYRVVDALDPDDPVEFWQEWWDKGQLPTTEIRDYLGRYADRFDLFDPEVPFFQVGDLRTSSGNTSGLGKLVAEMPDGYPFFTTRSVSDINRLSFAEAARWLVHVHAFDCSGIKSGAVGDARVKGGKGYPIGIGFCGWLGLLLAEGETLAQTLLLNLVLSMDTSRDRVPWEQPHLDASADVSHPEPLGPADAATWQARRVRLIHDGYAVTDAVLSNGDALGPQNRHNVEPNTSWRFSEPQTKKFGVPTYMPLLHDPSRSLWRGLSSTLGSGTTKAATKAGQRAYRPAVVLDWLATLRGEDVLNSDTTVVFRAIGMVYGAQSASVAAVIDDRLVLPLEVLTEQTMKQCAMDASDRADEAVRALGRLATNLADAAGRHLLPGMDDGARDRAVEDAFARLDRCYREWVLTVQDRSQLLTYDAAWQLTAREVVEDIAANLVVAAGTPAFVGRQVNDRFLNAPKAEIFFRSALRKALPSAFLQLNKPTSLTQHAQEDS
ncbi:hypothetical protein KEM60_00901 [Austwickia sp. TVS 96-490-7B]|uniref:type I-E CRISPR-associated protein Cse1/CasA n=1 Tax=Austwickia sp. TVS 96-490-7B TaxID=2830843 RepID=UPI001C56744F|nr:type I-E CRISPR-associated protein Cse1/CasA [Austwickia sp. TVS 96-490-7B]MBW3084712.1 hypothetical protein [Austwickia sp. TVS 96-490-7B]